ncbi:MAG: PIN domain-containing protein [Planctomycetes bacterium]|nr:PIN domain-containing protein [Planctomycetota bacterium]
MKRVEQRQLVGFTSSHVLADVAHRVMTLEAISLFGWPAAGIASRLRKHHAEIPKLTVYLQAIAQFSLLGIQVLPITQTLIEAATLLSKQHELLIGDGLLLASMQHHSLTTLASNDADFDRVPGLTRYGPV